MLVCAMPVQEGEQILRYLCTQHMHTHTKSNNTKKSENNPRNSYIITYLFFGIYQITFCTVLADQVYP